MLNNLTLLIECKILVAVFMAMLILMNYLLPFPPQVGMPAGQRSYLVSGPATRFLRFDQTPVNGCAYSFLFEEFILI